MKIILEVEFTNPGDKSLIKNELDAHRHIFDDMKGVKTNVRIIDENSKYGAPTPKQINYAKMLIRQGKLYVDKVSGEVITDPEIMTGEQIYEFIKENPPRNNGNARKGGGYQPKYGSSNRSKPPTSGSNAVKSYPRSCPTIMSGMDPDEDEITYDDNDLPF